MTRNSVHWLVVLACLSAVGCLDVRELQGPWHGQAIGQAVGFAADSRVQLQLDEVQLDSIRGRLTIDGVIDDAQIAPISGVNADVLATLTHTGSPTHVQLCFVDTIDGGGSATVVLTLYDASRIEVRVLRGGAQPLYGVFRMTPGQ